MYNESPNTPQEIVQEAAKSGVKVSFHLTPMALSFSLSLLLAVVGLIAWLVDKPSQAEVNRQIDVKQSPIIQRLDDLRTDVRDFRGEFESWRLAQPIVQRDGTQTRFPH
jgi:hypothetical protein